MTMFSRVLVANRGEIAVRVLRTLRTLGISGVAVYSDADAGARHVTVADHAVRLGPSAPSESYLAVDRIIRAALDAGADALHPGYGFLSESAELARACTDAGVTFIGPGPGAIAAMGDKIQARNTVAAAGVPVVPGRGEPGLSDDQLVAAALELGMPVLLKPSAGGGGKGMRLVEHPDTLEASIASARREARVAFGDDTLLIERFVARPRHIEIQVAADRFGSVVHLGERECSLQRRHQKIIEESPSPFITPEVRAAMGHQAVEVARACGYENVGTVEFIVSGDRADDFYFMEMNTRLQVEHPVTEETYGIDLVELQLRISAGEPLPWKQDDLRPSAHAVEARIYAEDPANGFLPTGGTVRLLQEPALEGVRVDSGLALGTVVGSSYDPMLSKVIARGHTRDEAVARLRSALRATSILGVTTNVAYLGALLDTPEVRAGSYDTGFVEQATIELPPLPDEALAGGWLRLIGDPGAPQRPWSAVDGWRLGQAAWITGALEVDGRRVEVRARHVDGGVEFAIDDGEPSVVDAAFTSDEMVVSSSDRTMRFAYALTPEGSIWIGRHGQTWELVPAVAVNLRAAGEDAEADGAVRSPMPGTAASVLVTPGQVVRAGEPVAVVEAMKMEHTVAATIDGVVEGVHVQAGEQVTMRQVLVTIAAPSPGFD